MDFSMNSYQGCEHGCSYCYARTTHEFLGMDAGLDFERKIMFKPNSAKLLRKKLNSKSWKASGIMLSGNTDCYQPIERKLKLTRGLLEVLLEFRNPVGIITKNSLIERDLDLLSELARHNLIKVIISITTLDEKLRSKMEPRTSSTKNKLRTIKRLTDKGVPVQILIGPVIPGINSHEIPEIIRLSADAGALWVGSTMIRLNGAVEGIFKDWLMKNYPDRSNKVFSQIKEINGGKYSNTVGERMNGKGVIAKMITDLIDLNRKKYMPGDKISLNIDDFKRPGDQLGLF